LRPDFRLERFGGDDAVQQSVFPFKFPETTQAAVAWICGAFLATFILITVIEALRRWMNRRMQIRAEWRVVDNMMRERGFSGEEQNLLRSMIQAYSPKTPLPALTTRRNFDACVEQKMDALFSSGDMDRFEKVGIMLRDLRVRLGLDYIAYGMRIFSTRELHVGQMLWIAPAGKGPTWTKCLISAIDEAYFYVAPKDKDAPLPALGNEVRFHLWRENDARYEFAAKRMRANESEIPWTILHTRGLNRIQARNFYRIRFHQEATVGILAAYGEEDAVAGLRPRRVVTRFGGTLTSLSAGGFALVTQHAIREATLIRTRIAVPGSPPFEVEAETVGVEHISGRQHLVRARFTAITEDNRDIIAKYVLQAQRPRSGSIEPQEPEAPETSSEDVTE